MTLSPILLVGAGGHARSCIDVIEQEGRFTVVGLIGTQDEIGTTVLGYPVIGGDDDLDGASREIGTALVTVGQIKTPIPRIRLFEILRANSCVLPLIVSPRAYVSRHSTLGDGSIVMHGAIVNSGVRIGRNCILNSNSLVEHDSVVGDNCHVATSAVLNSGVHVGEGTFIGSNASVRQGIIIGERCVVGMGQVLLADCKSGAQLPPRNTV
jgi:sugar O-acyltransferase (sialic acid O-acetyltransferase NeuD family)